MNQTQDLDDLAELSRFFADAWPGDIEISREETINWRYRQNDDDPSLRGRHVICRRNGSIAAHLGLLPCRVECESELIPAAWLFDWITLPQYRGSRSGMKVMSEACAAYPLVMAIGLTNDSESIFRRSGWHDAGPINRRCVILDPAAIAAARHPGAGKIPGTSLFASVLRTASRRPVLGDYKIVIQEDLPDRAEAVVNSSINSRWVRVRRDAAYLQGRYVSPPFWSYNYIFVRKSSQTTGWAVWSKKTRDDKVVIARLLEFHASREHPGAALALLNAFINDAIDSKVHMIEITTRNFVPDYLFSGLLFRKRKGLRLMWRWNSARTPAPAFLQDANRWAVSGGDSDQDR